MIGCQDFKVAAIGRLLCYCYFRSVYCLLKLSVSFEVMYVSIVVRIGLEFLFKVSVAGASNVMQSHHK